MSKMIGKPVHVTWVDSMQTPGWQTAHKDANLICESVGFLADKNKKRIKLYMNSSSHCKGDYIEIPRIAVKKMRYLK